MPTSVPFTSPSSATRLRRLARAGAAVALAATLSVTAGCGFDVQTNLPYTQAEGVNADVGPRQAKLEVRNLLIISKEDGSGFVSASIGGTVNDTLQRITGRAYKADGAAGSPLTATLTPVQITAGQLTVLTDQQLITVTGADLKPGLEAELTLTFATTGEVTLRMPVVSADDPMFATVSPTASPSPTPEASASGG